MGKTRARIWRFPFYLWLLGIYPILHLYVENLGLVFEAEVAIASAFALAASTICFAAGNMLTRDMHKTALMLGICSLAFSLSGHLYLVVFSPGSLLAWTLALMLLVGIILALITRIASPQFYSSATAILNVIILALLIVVAVTLASGLAASPAIDLSITWDGAADRVAQKSPKLPHSPERPDIYFIIPDGYPSDIFLQEAMNYDNSAFTQALEARGFTVAGHAQSNYGISLTSLASTLNMRYFDRNDTQLADLDYLRLAWADSEVARKLLQRGYTYIHTLSGFTIPSPIADINRNFTADGPVDLVFSGSSYVGALERAAQRGRPLHFEASDFHKQSFFPLYLDTTLLRRFASQIVGLLRQIGITRDDFLARNGPRRFLATVEDAQAIAAMPEATFAIIHLLKPHGPASFDASGNITALVHHPDRETYFADFEFVNAQFLRMIDAILEKSDVPPVIIFQADHGTVYGRVEDTEGAPRFFDVYAAYHLPGGARLPIPTPHTLINSFPLIFNAVFGTDYPLLDNRIYLAPSGYYAPFDQQDVTAEYLNDK